MYPLDRGLWGPTVRITHLRDELARLVELDRRRRLPARPARGAGRATHSPAACAGSTASMSRARRFLPSETDIAFLALARALRVPVLTYVRDAYQLFAEYGAGRTLRGRRRCGRLQADDPRPARRLEPPGISIGRPRGGGPRQWGRCRSAAAWGATAGRGPAFSEANRLLFVGDARLPAHGADRLIAAVALARQAGSPVELTIVCRPGQEPPPPHPDWLRLERAEGTAIPGLLGDVVATVIPRPRGRYNDLALPIKLFDYLSYGRPLLVTDCTEQARVVTTADAGIVTADDPASLADAITRMLSAPPDVAERWSANAMAAARAASWEDRARQIIRVLGLA